MAITINGTGSITGLTAGGLPDGSVTTDDLAANAVTAAKIGYAGAILQVVQTVKTDTNSHSGSTWGDTGLSATITPSSSSSKILVLVDAMISSDVGYAMKIKLLRNSTDVYVGNAATNQPRVSRVMHGTYSTGVNSSSMSASVIYLDSPSTTSATTYKLQFGSYTPNTIYLNRTGNDAADTTNQFFDGRGASSITLLEVAG
jgi:hypothetical protein